MVGGVGGFGFSFGLAFGLRSTVIRSGSEEELVGGVAGPDG